MDVINGIIKNSSLDGMPNWYKVTTLLVFTSIVILLIAMTAVLVVHGPDGKFNYGY